MTTAMAMAPSPRASGRYWLAIALSCAVHLAVLALLLALGRFSPAEITLQPLAMVVEIVSLPAEPVLQPAATPPARPDPLPAAAETPIQPTRQEQPAVAAKPETEDTLKDVEAPPPLVAAKAEPLWFSLTPSPPRRPTVAKAVGRAPTVQNAGRLAATPVKKTTALPASTGGAAAQERSATPQATGVPSPRPLAGNPVPRYPARAQRRGWQGRVLVRLAITGAGRVADAAVARSSGHGVLDRAAQRTLKSWRFETGSFGADARIIAEVTVPVVFRLHGGGVAVNTTMAER